MRIKSSLPFAQRAHGLAEPLCRNRLPKGRATGVGEAGWQRKVPICWGTGGTGGTGGAGLPEPLWPAHGPCQAAAGCDSLSSLSIGLALCRCEVD